MLVQSIFTPGSVTREIPPRISTDTPVTTQDVSDDTSARFDFENMTVAEYENILNELFFSGRISGEQMIEISITCIPPCPPNATQEEFMAMPAGVSHSELRDTISFTSAAGRIEERDRHQRVLDVLLGLEGTMRRVDTTA